MSITIGKLSQATAVNVETIRYYERIGLLAAPLRTSSGYRSYTAQDVARLRFKARKLGISEIIAQGRNVRVSKFEPRESVQMRMARIYKGIQYRPLTKTYLVPAPFAGSLGSKPMSSDEVVGWTSQLLDDLDWKPTPRQ